MNEKVNSIKEEILNDINSISSLKELGDLKLSYESKTKKVKIKIEEK